MANKEYYVATIGGKEIRVTSKYLAITLSLVGFGIGFAAYYCNILCQKLRSLWAFCFNRKKISQEREALIFAIVYEEIDELGGRRYVAKLAELVDLDKEKPYSMMGLGPSWNHRDLAILVMYRHDVKKAAEILGRTEDACRRKLRRLGLAMGVDLKKEAPQIMLVFPREQIELRKAVTKQVKPRLKKLLEMIDKAEDLSPETINDLAKIVRATAALLNAVEKWETGEETLQIWAHELEEEDEEDADQPGF